MNVSNAIWISSDDFILTLNCKYDECTLSRISRNKFKFVERNLHQMPQILAIKSSVIVKHKSKVWKKYFAILSSLSDFLIQIFFICNVTLFSKRKVLKFSFFFNSNKLCFQRGKFQSFHVSLILINFVFKEESSKFFMHVWTANCRNWKSP